MENDYHLCHANLGSPYFKHFEYSRYPPDAVILDVTFHLQHTMRKNLPKTLDQLIFGKYTLNLSKFTKNLVNVLKFTKYLVNVPKFTKYLVNSYHQKDVKHYVLTN